MSGGRGDPVFFFYMVWEHPWSLFFERGWNEDNQFIMYILGGGFKDVSNLEEMMYFNELIFPNKMVQPPTWCVCVFKGPSLQPFFFRVVLLGFREFCFFLIFLYLKVIREDTTTKGWKDILYIHM